MQVPAGALGSESTTVALTTETRATARRVRVGAVGIAAVAFGARARATGCWRCMRYEPTHGGGGGGAHTTDQKPVASA
jgi:hypothetical protein